MTDELRHIGTPRHSGRYPWGSGDNPKQWNTDFLGMVDNLKKRGLSDKEIYEGMKMNSTEFRDRKAIAKNEKNKDDAAQVMRLKDKNVSNIEIGKIMNRNESSVRALADPKMQARNDVLGATANMLKENVGTKKYLDVGVSAELFTGVSRSMLNIAVAKLEDEGYQIQYVKVPQVGNPGKFTSMKVLVAPKAPYMDLVNNQHLISPIKSYTEDGGHTYKTPVGPPVAVSSKRVSVRYKDDGGSGADGVIYVRRGVPDVSLGHSSYVQVRIAVDGTHYLKGMAIYKDDLPKGIDLEFNTNKTPTGNKLDAMKKVSEDKENPFTSAIKPRYYNDAKGKEHRSAMNIVNEEGDWFNWSHKFSSQMLSKQPIGLAKEQLRLTHEMKKAEYDEIMALTNPTIKKKLLTAFADGADASSTLLQAAGLPRTRSHVLIPIPSMKDTEIYAPNFDNGERVVLIRHPHGGTFEIPELTVNNRHKDAKTMLGNARDAIGINAKVAERLSGADFDGDAVLVIPNNHPRNDPRTIQTSPALKGLKNFDPKSDYKAYPGMRPMRDTQHQMGDISNLITDMTIKGAIHAELARAVRHSMVVIDAEKHNLDYRQSAKDNNIRELKTRYQGKADGGASTLISRAKSEERVPDRLPRRAKLGGPVDAATGKLMYTPTNKSYLDRKTGKVVLNKTRVKRMLNVDNAHTLSSGTSMESVYADHANRLKALGNAARKSALETPLLKKNRTATLAYAPQVSSLNAKLNLALKNSPVERQAQLLANEIVRAKVEATPGMDSGQLKTVRGSALKTARDRTGAGKKLIDITDSEWTAIQAGAISNNALTKILNNTDIDKLKTRATPRVKLEVEGASLARAKAMLAAGHTQAEIATQLGVPASTLNDALSR